MLTRRQFSGAAAMAWAPRAVFARASQPSTGVAFEVPEHACDCHTHVFGDPQRFPWWPGRTYTPEPAAPGEMLQMHRALGIERVVIVTPSVYGTDNSATLDGMEHRGPAARGVAVIGPETLEESLDAMQRRGIRGIRLNLATAGVNNPAVARERLRSAVRRVRRLGWHVQILTSPAVIQGIAGVVREAEVPVVFDHFGGAQATLGVSQPGFPELLELVGSGAAYVKISAAYRCSTRAPGYADVLPLARALIEANPHRIVWGTDWPHPDTSSGRKPTETSPLLPVDDGRVLNLLAAWAPDPMVRAWILVENPARLYGF